MNTLKSPRALPGMVYVSLLVFAVAGCSTNKGITNAPPSQTVDTPSFSPAGGNYSTDQYVAISSTIQGATIYYTTDGSIPTTSSSVFSKVIPVIGDGTTETIKAIAVKSGMTTSPVDSTTYTISYERLPAPKFYPPAGNYSGDQSVAIFTSAENVRIYYTTDGSTPTTSSTVYTDSILVAGDGTNMTIKAFSVRQGIANSPVSSVTYSINYSMAAIPTFDPPPGTYNMDITVTIDSDFENATIYYTTDGSTPTTSSAKYTNPIPVAGDGTAMTINAIAVVPGIENPDVATASYSIDYTPKAVPSSNTTAKR
jgi:hypothetical protein